MEKIRQLIEARAAVHMVGGGGVGMAGVALQTGYAITTNGTDEAMFTVTAFPTVPVTGPSGSTTFTVQFAPTSSGAKTAVIQLFSNDGDENPFDISLAGTGTPPILGATVIKFR